MPTPTLGRYLELDGEDELTRILLAVPDKGERVIAAKTRKFMAMVAIAQHFGRPGHPDRPGVGRVLERDREARVAAPNPDH